jgi:hypothetical protein
MVGEFKKLVIRMNPSRFVSPNPNTDTPHGFDVSFPNLCGCVPSVNRAWFGLAVSPWTVAAHRLLLWRPQVILSLSKARSRLTFPVASDRHSMRFGDDVPGRSHSSFRDEVPGTWNTLTFHVPRF